MTYIPVYIYKNSLGDSTANGVSSVETNRFVVPVKNGFLSESDVENGDYIILEVEEMHTGYKCFKQKGDGRWLMNGGNFAYSTDARFSDTYGNQPIAIHDRYEG